MHPVFDAALPVFSLIWLGFFLKHTRMPGDDFWPLAEKITYFIFLPSLFFLALYSADFSRLTHTGPLVIAVTGTTLCMSAILFLLQYTWLNLDGKRFASLFQGSIRYNNYIGMPLITSLFGQEGLVIYALINGIAIPFTNILTVTVMSHYASESSVNIHRIIRSIVTNPLILAVAAGLLLNLLNVPLFFTHEIILSLAKASTALGLLTIGAGIEFATITSSKRNLTLICLLKLVIHPLIMLSFCFFFGIEGITRDVLLVYAALPVAASSYILARQFNAHGPLAASIVAITSLSCMLTLTTLLILL